MDAVIADNYPPVYDGYSSSPRKTNITRNLRKIYQFETELLIIWKKAGRSPYLFSYIRSELGESNTQLMKRLENAGLVENMGKLVPRDNRRLWKLKQNTVSYLENTYGVVSPEIEQACNEFTTRMKTDYTALHTSSAVKNWKDHKPDRDAAQRITYREMTRKLYSQVGTKPFLFREAQNVILSAVSLQILSKLGFIATVGAIRYGSISVWKISDAVIQELEEQS